MDRIFIEGLNVHSLIGVYEFERVAPQKLIVDVVIETDLHAASVSDAVADTIDYAAVASLLCEVAEKATFELLEALSKAMIDAMFDQFAGIQRVRLKLSKPDIVKEASNVAVELVRSRHA
ncbi:dihydroneopterin aldolase [Aestuariibacter salexigens]|uniref:dihydroneopterin aldolase n=1 Tax=Aestuariibacter salexigens TaxID=226010 RepID=UPI00041560F4|nr:dihydroneopterin aldolase [Aestuariibacter salexigens]